MINDNFMPQRSPSGTRAYKIIVNNKLDRDGVQQ